MRAVQSTKHLRGAPTRADEQTAAGHEEHAAGGANAGSIHFGLAAERPWFNYVGLPIAT